MDAADQQVLDIDEARIIISLKNDEINNMKSSIKAKQIRMNLKIADFQYNLQQSKNKLLLFQTKVSKSEQSLKKQKQKHQQQISELHRQIKQLKEMFEKLLNQGKQKQRELKGALQEENIKLQKQRQMNYKWVCQFQVISKYFDPKKILPLLQKDNLTDIPTYVDLYEKYLACQESLKHSNLLLSTIRSQIVSQMQESFQKLNNYQSLIQDLKLKNQQLGNQMQQKQNELILRFQEINQKKSLLEAVQLQASNQIQQLTAQLITLQKQFNNNYSREHEHQRAQSKSDTFYIQRIQDIQQKNYVKQTQYVQLIAENEYRIRKLQQENRMLKSEFQELQYKLTQNEEFKIVSSNYHLKEMQDYKKVIILVQATLKDKQEHLKQSKIQNGKLIKELNQIMISKQKLVQQYKIAEQEYRTHFVSLNQEIDQLRTQINIIAKSQNRSESNYKNQVPEINNESHSQKNSKLLKGMMSQKGSVCSLENSKNLFFDLNDKIELQVNDEQMRSDVDFGNYEDDPRWPQKYYSLLQKHNIFIKKVYSHLKGIRSKQN